MIKIKGNCWSVADSLECRMMKPGTLGWELNFYEGQGLLLPKIQMINVKAPGEVQCISNTNTKHRLKKPTASSL